MVNVLESVPTAFVFMNHWYARGAVPVALTTNVAVCPAVTVRLVGWEEIAGAAGGGFPLLELEPQPPRHASTAKRSTGNCKLALNLKAASAKQSDSDDRSRPRKIPLHQPAILSLRRVHCTCSTGQISTYLAKACPRRGFTWNNPSDVAAASSMRIERLCVDQMLQVSIQERSESLTSRQPM
jgi:hypothetical protein